MNQFSECGHDFGINISKSFGEKNASALTMRLTKRKTFHPNESTSNDDKHKSYRLIDSKQFD